MVHTRSETSTPKITMMCSFPELFWMRMSWKTHLGSVLASGEAIVGLPETSAKEQQQEA